MIIKKDRREMRGSIRILPKPGQHHRESMTSCNERKRMKRKGNVTNSLGLIKGRTERVSSKGRQEKNDGGESSDGNSLDSRRGEGNIKEKYHGVKGLVNNFTPYVFSCVSNIKKANLNTVVY